MTTFAEIAAQVETAFRQARAELPAGSADDAVEERAREILFGRAFGRHLRLVKG